jgi:hypothetical protein
MIVMSQDERRLLSPAATASWPDRFFASAKRSDEKHRILSVALRRVRGALLSHFGPLIVWQPTAAPEPSHTP